MSKHKRKRFLSILITAVLVFTLALSSVMAQDDEHVRTDKLSVGGESVEVIEGVTGEDDADVVADEAITADDAETEETDADEAADAEEISAEDATEEADADAAEDDADADAGIMTLSAGDVEDDEYGIQTLADVTSNLQGAIDAASSGDTITLGDNITESVTIASGKNITLDLNGHTLNGNGNTVITVEGTLTLKDSSSAGTGTVTGANATHGGVIVQNGGNFTLSSGTISGNTANGGSGAGVYVESATFTMTGGTISGNTATRYGGGVNITCNGSDSTFTMTGGTISGNTASQMYGGGVFVENKSGGESTFTMSGGTISGNTSSYGAGVTVNGATVNLSGSATITSNNGCNVYLYDSTAELNMSGGTISEGSATSGGGVYAAAGTFNMSGGAVSDNTATGSGDNEGGGGIFVDNGATFYMTDGTVSDNTGSGFGGGIYIQHGGTFNMSGGTISSNNAKAGAGVELGSIDSAAGAVFNFSGGTISDNTATNIGGGVELRGYGNVFNMSGGTISGNKTTSATNNYGGGGVGLHSGEFTMTGGTISGNESAYYGGGVYDYYFNGSYAGEVSSGFTLSGGEITGNKARQGGGVYLYNNSGTTFTVSGGAVSGNTESDGTTTDNVYLPGSKKITLGTDLSMVPQTLATYRVADQVGVMTASDSTITDENSVQFTTAESTTDYYSTSNLYFFSDTGTATDGNSIGVRASSNGNYLELYEVTRPTFETTYLIDPDDSDDPDANLYTSATVDNYAQILAGASDWELLSDEDKELVNKDLTDAWVAAGGEGDLTYEDLLAQARAIAEYADFEKEYLTDSDGQLYTEATTDNYEQILAGESDWDALSDEAKAQINADLTAANGGEELTYPMLLEQAKAIADANAFEETYLTGSDGELYTEATADNYEQILAGESDWDALSDEAKAQINADLTAANGGEELTYPMLLAQAKAMGFEDSYLTGSDGELYTAATADNYEQILAGESDWDALSDEAKAQINADLTAAWQEKGNEGELTYPMLLAQAKAMDFEDSYLTGSDGNLYTAATADNYEQILAGESDWDALSDEAKAQINADLTAANGGEELTYPMLLAQAKAIEFEEKYLTDEDGNGPYTAATTANMDQILSGADDWNAMSDEEKAAVNAALTEANGGVELTYDELLAQAFMLKYLTDEDGNLYTEVNADNYLKILSGEDDWNRLSPEAQALVNMYLTAAWQDEGNEGELTYPMLLEQAKAFADSLGRVKTGDDTRLYLYVILAAAAAAAAAGVAVSRRRRV